MEFNIDLMFLFTSFWTFTNKPAESCYTYAPSRVPLNDIHLKNSVSCIL